MELSRKFSKRRCFKSTIVYFLTCCMFFNTSLSVALAGPEGAQVVNGQVSFQQSSYNTTITASDKSIINYSSFDIARPEIVEFIQPGSSASVLNRILSANPTNINGTLLANGRVFFVNPAGVYIGAGARVNVNQLVASGLNITNSDFINGQYNFAGGDGAVINSGDISAEKVYLIGRQVANSGSISCPAGYVVMASGDRVFLGEPGTDVVLEMDAPSSPESAEPIEGSGVLNEGTVDAAGGTIVLAAGDIYSQAISNTGSLSASVETGEAGQITLTSDDGTVINSGTIEAIGSKGGQVTMEGARVGQFGAIHADGIDSDGGSVDLLASEVVALSSDSITTANAGTNGDGGEVIVYSPDTALFRDGARIEVKGGTESGDGGFVEISGKKHVEVDGIADRTAVNGESGMLLIDPANIFITDNDNDTSHWIGGTDDFEPKTTFPGEIDIDTLEGHLDSGDTTITTAWGGGGQDPDQEGNVTFDAGRDLKDGVSGGSNNSLTINADGSIIFNSGVNFTGSGNLSLNVGSSGSIDLDADISLGSGMLSSNATTVNVLSNSAKIQDAIDIAEPYATINVSGNAITPIIYEEDLVITKNGLNLAGADDDHPEYTVIQAVDKQFTPVFPDATNSTNVDIQADEIEIHGFKFLSPLADASIQEYSSGIVLKGTDIEIHHNIFETQQDATSGSGTFNGDTSVAIQTYSGEVSGHWPVDISGLYIHDNKFQGTPANGYYGVYINPQDQAITESNPVRIENNEFTGTIWRAITTERSYTNIFNNTITTSTSNSAGSNSGIRVVNWANDNVNHVTIQDNEVAGAASGQGFGFGIGLGTGYGDSLTDVIVTENEVSGDHVLGVQVNSPLSNVTIEKNSLTGGTTTLDLQNTTAAAVDASGNWWGSSDEATIQSRISNTGGGSVEYSPWLGNAGSSTTDPFDYTPDLSSIYTSTSIQDAIDLAASGATINVIADTYIENINVNKQLAGLYFIGGAPSEIDGTLTLSDDVASNTGVDIYTQNDGDLTLNDIVDGDTHSLLVDTESLNTTDGQINLDGSVEADGGITITGGIVNVGDSTSDKLNSNGIVSIEGTDTVTVNAEIDPTTVSITSNNDIAINNKVTADNLITVNAGKDDGTGNVTVDHTGSNAGELKTTVTGSDIIITTGTTNGNILLDGPVTAADQVTMTASGGKINGAGLVTASTVALNADTGIGDSTALELAASTISADNTTSGNIDIDNTYSGSVTVTSLTTGTGTILFSQDGDGSLDVTLASTVDGSIGIDVDDATLTARTVTAGGSDIDDNVSLTTTTSGDVIVDDITAAGNTIAIDSDGAISEVSEGDEPDADLTAATLSLTADTGITGQSAIETSATDITASTDAGNIDIDNTNASATTASLEVTMEAGTILFSQDGGGSLDVTLASTVDGSIGIDVDDATLTARTVTAGGSDTDDNILLTTTTSGDVIVDDITAAGNTIAIDSDGAISEVSEGDEPDADLTAATLSLTADTGITGQSPIETSATDITASTDSGNIDIDNSNGSATTASLEVTTEAGTILFSQDGGGSLDVTLASTVDGSIGIDVDNATLTARTVTAGGSDIDDNVSLTTTTSGDVIVDDITAAGNTIAIDSDGAISEVSEGDEPDADLTAATLSLTADTGITGQSAIETSATAITASTDAGDIDIDNDNASLTTASLAVTPGAGNILFSQTGGGDLGIKAQTADGDIDIDVANANLIAGSITAGSTGNVTLEALQGGMSGGTITANGGTLIMKQQDSLNLKDLAFGNQGSTDLTVQSDNGSFTADNTVTANAADKWKSITATAGSGITLEGSSHITTKVLTTTTGNISVHSTGGDLILNGAVNADPVSGDSLGGGVELIADAGTIYTSGAHDYLNVPITGTSDGATGVTLPVGSGKAAIVIWSKKQDLKLGANATLTANGSYYDTGVDDRSSVNFAYVPTVSDATGEPIDIAIYLGSYNHQHPILRIPLLPLPLSKPYGGNVTVDSTVSMPANGTMVIDAYDTVNAFGGDFTDSDPWKNKTTNNSLEVASRISATLDDAAEHDRLPHAKDALSDTPPTWFNGKHYILRGGKFIIGSLAQVLAKIEPVPLVLPKPLVPEDQGQVEVERRDAAVLGLGDKPELARAYPPSLNTDLNLDKAAQILFVLMPILRDSSRIAILDRIVVEIWQDVDQPIAPEQEAMIAQRMSGTPAEEWVAALTEYVDVMSTMVGRPKTESVLWVMQTYVIPQAEQGLLQDQTVAFLEAQID